MPASCWRDEHRDTRWRQVFVRFDDWTAAERIAATNLGAMFGDAESAGLISSWFFVRKAPCWRLRFLTSDSAKATSVAHQHLSALQRVGLVARWVESIYEPEIHAFGGPAGMDTAHHLFHQDSRHVLSYLSNATKEPSDRRRELSILLACLLMRSSGLDWHEQGDVWARVAEHRTLPSDIPPSRRGTLEPSLRRLITVDTAALVQGNGPLAHLADWAFAFTHAGKALGELANTGVLQRGLRAVLAKHVIFAWNRIGLPHTTQSLLSNTAQTVIFGA